MALNERHEDALKVLAPIDLCEQMIGTLIVPTGTPCMCQFCQIRRVDAGYLDGLAGVAQDVLASIFSYEQAAPVDLWEDFLGLSYDPSLTEVQRWARVRVARQTSNGISKAFLESLATRLGYSVVISRGIYPARAGIAKVDDQVKRVNRLTTPVAGDSNDIRNHSEVVTNPMDRSSGNTPITVSNPYPSDFWTFVVSISSLGTNSDSVILRERFEALKPYYSQIVWEEP